MVKTIEELRKELQTAEKVEIKAAADYDNAEIKANNVREKAIDSARAVRMKETEEMDAKYNNVFIPAKKMYEESMAPITAAYLKAFHAREAIQEQIKQREMK